MIQKEDISEAIVCRENDTALEVSRILRDVQRRHLIVLDSKDAPIGIISTVDLNNRVLAEEISPKEKNAKDIMTKSLISVSLDDTYEKAFQIMAKLGTNSIPVVEKGKLKGMLEFVKAMKRAAQKSGVN